MGPHPQTAKNGTDNDIVIVDQRLESDHLLLAVKVVYWKKSKVICSVLFLKGRKVGTGAPILPFHQHLALRRKENYTVWLPNIARYFFLSPVAIWFILQYCRCSLLRQILKALLLGVLLSDNFVQEVRVRSRCSAHISVVRKLNCINYKKKKFSWRA